MTDVIEQVQTEDEALASALAGYNARNSSEFPAEEVATSAPEEITPAEDDVQSAEETAPEPDPEPAEPTVAEKLEALKAEVKAMKDATDPEVVRKLHGEIGNINRTIKQLQEPEPQAPATDEVAEALADAEKLAVEFPEVGAPLVRALKALSSKVVTAAAPMPDIDSVVASKVSEIRQREAIEALAEEHPDYETVRDTPEFKKWFSSKTPEYQERVRTTWNPAVVAKSLTEFKASLTTKQEKQNRLAAAVTPRGVAAPPGPSVIPDEDGYAIGYGRKR